MIIVVMGVCASGKSTFGRALADRLGLPFREGDDYHPPANIAAMSAGSPLTDAMRAPWLAAMTADIDAAAPTGLVLACSALKRRYRQTLIGARPGAHLIHLSGPRDLLTARLDARRDHFMPVTLLDSQLATLESPGPDENPLVLPIDWPLERQLDVACAHLSAAAISHPSPNTKQPDQGR